MLSRSDAYEVLRDMRRKEIAVVIGIAMVLSTFASLAVSGIVPGDGTSPMYVPHAPIQINSNAEFASMALAEGWDGAGTEADPYIIENYDINGTGSMNCIGIGSTTYYFEVRNCFLHDSDNRGLALDSVYGSTVSGNVLLGNAGSGMAIFSCVDITVANNTASNNDVGIVISVSNNNTIINNQASSNLDSGIYLYTSSNNAVIENHVSLSGDDGIYLIYADENLITGNILSSNHNGIKTVESDYNEIYHNNFMDNAFQASNDNFNSWDNGYPSGGNYWSDYSGNDGNGDGIGDTPYYFTGGQDNYPLMAPMDFINPTIISTSPSEGQLNVSINTDIIVQFSEQMNQLSVENAFHIYPHVNGTFTWNGAGDEMTYSLNGLMVINNSYYCQVDDTATDLAGNRLEGNGGIEIPICTEIEEQAGSEIYEDKIIWYDDRNENIVPPTYRDVYMYNLSTNVETPICTNSSNQLMPDIYDDLIVWCDYRNIPLTESDIYAYNLSNSTEFPICLAPGNQYIPDIYGNKIVWLDWRSGISDIYMYDLSTGNETPICIGHGQQYVPAIYGDKIVWVDQRNGNKDIYMYDLSTGNETPICLDPTDQDNPAIYGDNIVWMDWGLNATSRDLFIHNISTNTTSPLCTAPGNQHNPDIYKNIVVWSDYRNGNSDIYMYDLTIGYEVPLCTNPNGQSQPNIYENIITWTDDRNGSDDIFLFLRTYGWHFTTGTTISGPVCDLSISQDDITFSDTSPDKWDEITIEATVRNIGQIDAMCTVSLYLDVIDPDNLIYREYEVFVPVGESTQVSAKWLANITGDHDIIVDITDSEPVDVNILNNIASRVLSIAEPCGKLKVKASSDKQKYVTGTDDHADIIVKVTYLGQLISGASVSAFVIDPTGANSSVSLTEAYEGIYVGSYPFTNASAAGTYRINAIATKPGYLQGENYDAKDKFFLDSPVPQMPEVGSVALSANILAGGTDLTVTTDVLNPVGVESIFASLSSHVHWGTFVRPMYDDGTHSDAVAGDGTFTAVFDTADMSKTYTLDISINGLFNEKLDAIMVSPTDYVAIDSFTGMQTAACFVEMSSTETNVTIGLNTVSDISGINFLIVEHRNATGGKDLEFIPSGNAIVAMTYAHIDVSYTEDDIPANVSEDSLRLWVYNAYTERLEPLEPGGVDTLGDLIWGDTEHFSEFKMMSSPPGMSAYTMQLAPGWNLISFPVQLDNGAIERVLSPITGLWDSAKYYDSTDAADPWKSYRPGSSVNDLHEVDHTMALWLHMSSSAELPLFGVERTSTQIALHTGWNFVGYPTLKTGITVSVALWGTGADRVEVMDQGSPTLLMEAGPNYVLSPGQGLWVHVTADSIWTVNG